MLLGSAGMLHVQLSRWEPGWSFISLELRAITGSSDFPVVMLSSHKSRFDALVASLQVGCGLAGDRALRLASDWTGG